MAGTWNPEGFGIAKSIFSLSGDSEDMIVTHGFRNDTDLDPDSCADAVYNAWDAGLAASDMGTGWTWRGIEIQQGTATGSGGPVGSHPTTLGGSAAATTLPQNCAVLVHKRTPVGGRRGRGRFYLPPAFLAESLVGQTGEISSVQVISLQSVVDAILSSLTTFNVEMVLLHVQGANVIPPYPVTQLTVDPIISTQRQRLRR